MVTLTPRSALRGLVNMALPPDQTTQVTFHLPDFSAQPLPGDKAKLLLESAAEIEHALMVQYLYACFSLHTDGAGQTPEQAGVISDWAEAIINTAKEEMGHLLTVQNLLLALGFAPNVEREDFPFRNGIYPFPFGTMHLTKSNERAIVCA